MPIKVVAAPKNALKLLQAGIEKNLAAGMVDAVLGQIARVGSPHRVFHLGLDALVAEKPIARAAKHVGWSATLVDRRKQAVAAAELALTRDGVKFACVNRGPHATGAGAGEAVAARWSKEAKGDHELALLRIPGAYCTALWIRGADGKDAFIPIAPCPDGLRPNIPYGEKDLRAALLPEARKQLELPSQPPTKR
ncbi:MAG: hypothetical protein ACREEP_17995 [Dongiaceae bacterium]